MKLKNVVKNISGISQEIHYTDGSVIVKHGEEHTLKMDKLQKPEYERIKNVFKFGYEKEPEQKPVFQPKIETKNKESE